MLKIDKMKNCYGIKELKMGNGAEFKKINLIFAPNGTFKTSFFNTLKEYSQGNLINVTDRLTGEEAQLSIFNNGKKLKEEEIVLFDKEIVAEIDKMKSLKLITDKKVLTDFNRLQMFLSNFSNLEKKDEAENKMEYLLKLADRCTSDEFLTYKNDFSIYLEKNGLEKITEDDFKKSKLFDKNIQEDIKNVISIESKALDIIKENFGIKDIENSMDFIEKLYSAGHTISIKTQDNHQNKIETFKEFEEIFNNEKKELQESLEKNSTEFKKIIKTLDNNAKNRKIKESISSQINNLELFNDKEEDLKLYYNYEKFKDIDIKEVKKSYENLIEYSKLIDTNKLEETVKQFNNRFYDYLKIKIQDEKDNELGITLQKVFIEFYNEAITGEKIFEIASSGEKNALAMFILMHSVISSQSDGKLLLIDDELEVFDYAFKHSFIEYLNDISTNDNIKMIVLTHNYDFIRSFYNKIDVGSGKRKDVVSLLVAYKTKSQIINLTKIKNLNQLSLSNMHKNINEKNILSYIVTKRNIEEIEQKNNEFNFLTNFLHLKDETLDLTMDDIVQYIRENSKNSVLKLEKIDLSKKYIDFLYEQADLICTNCLGNNDLFLDQKITLSIACRMKFEAKFKGSNKFEYNQTRGIFNTLSIEDKINYNEVNVIIPDFIHLNAFAYEPLMDIKIDRLIQFYKKF